MVHSHRLANRPALLWNTHTADRAASTNEPIQFDTVPTLQDYVRLLMHCCRGGLASLHTDFTPEHFGSVLAYLLLTVWLTVLVERQQIEQLTIGKWNFIIKVLPKCKKISEQSKKERRQKWTIYIQYWIEWPNEWYAIVWQLCICMLRDCADESCNLPTLHRYRT